MADKIDLADLVNRDPLTVTHTVTLTPKEDPEVQTARLSETRLDNELRRLKERGLFFMAGVVIGLLTIFAIVLVVSGNGESSRLGRDLILLIIGGALSAFGMTSKK